MSGSFHLVLRRLRDVIDPRRGVSDRADVRVNKRDLERLLRDYDRIDTEYRRLLNETQKS